jgi:hypothetical protein
MKLKFNTQLLILMFHKKLEFVAMDTLPSKDKAQFETPEKMCSI